MAGCERECYIHQCIHHFLLEPFCGEDECKETIVCQKCGITYNDHKDLDDGGKCAVCGTKIERNL